MSSRRVKTLCHVSRLAHEQPSLAFVQQQLGAVKSVGFRTLEYVDKGEGEDCAELLEPQEPSSEELESCSVGVDSEDEDVKWHLTSQAPSYGGADIVREWPLNRYFLAKRLEALSKRH